MLIPLIATVALTVAAGKQLAEKAARARTAADSVHIAGVTGALVRSLQQERLLSVGFLRGEVDKGQVARQQAEVADRLADYLSANAGNLTPAGTVTLTNGVANLNRLRAAVLARLGSPALVMGAFGPAIGYLIDSVRLLDAVDGNTPQGREVVALDSLMRVNEGFDALFAAMAAVDSPSELVPYLAAIGGLTPAVTRFNAYATADQVAFFQSSAAAIDSRLGTGVTVAIVTTPATVLSLKRLPSFAELESMSGFGRYLESKIIGDVTAAVGDSVRLELTGAIGFAGVSLATIVLAVLLGVAVVRSVTRPLGQLTVSANRVARLAESELVRVADADVLTPAPIRLAAVDVDGRDEIGDLARAFERVQETAARLVERQVASRRNVALMFGHVGRRTQNLVGRQSALIDRISAQVIEPDPRRDIERLQMVASRLRRSATSLVVLSGAVGADERMAPMPLLELISLALGEIEDSSRVDVEVSSQVQVAPALINDLVLLLAELMDNAVLFSPPTTRVVVSAQISGVGARVEVVDHGLGLSPQRLAEENARLAARERLDLAPTEVLGLFVVGRLARRHGLRVSLSATRNGGTTAAVDLPATLLTSVRQFHDPGANSRPSAVGTDRTARSGAHAEPATGRPAGLALPGRTVRALVLAQGRPALPPALLDHPDPDVFDVAALDRASQSINAVESWNAFAAVTPAIEAGPSAGRSGPGSQPNGPAGDRSAMAARAVSDPGWAPAAASHAAPVPAAGPHSGEHPGWGEGTPQPGWSTSIAPHWSTQQASSHVAALQPHSAPPLQAHSAPPLPAHSAPPLQPRSAPPLQPHSAPPIHPDSAAPMRPYSAPPVQPHSPAPTSWPPFSGTQPPEPVVPHSVASAAIADLNRRVPGATLSALEASQPSGHTTVELNQRVEDAEQVRDSLAQFESGVARALREVDRPDEG